MRITGIQSLSLLDFPNHPCSIIFTQGCVFRCVYCHNPELIEQNSDKVKILDTDAVLDRLKKKSGMIEGACITGGEPTLQPDLPEFIAKIKALGLKVKLDTNGIHPQMVRRCIDKKILDYIAMDIKHVWEKYEKIIGLKNNMIIKNCQRSMQIIQTSDIPHEFRITVFPSEHTETDLAEMIDQGKGGERFVLQKVRYEKTLVPNLKQTEMNLNQLVSSMRLKRPDLCIELR